MNCDRCGKKFKLLFPVGEFQVCTTCCDKVRAEITRQCDRGEAC